MEHGLISNIIPLIENLLKHYGAFTVGVSVFLLGENAALAVFALAAQGMINPLTAFIWAFVGSLLSDVFWFFIAEYCLRDYYERRILKAKQVESNRFFMRMVDKHFFWMLIFIKHCRAFR